MAKKEPTYNEPIEARIVKNSDGTGFYRDMLHGWSDGLRWDGQDIDTPAMKEFPDTSEDYREYLKDVSLTGNDYLGELLSATKTKHHKEPWTFVFSKWIGWGAYGLRLVGAKHGRKDIQIHLLPQYAKDFIEFNKQNSSDILKTDEDIESTGLRERGGRYYWTGTLEYTEEIGATTEQVKRLAKKALRDR